MASLSTRIEETLRGVMDPHMGVNLHDMGMLRGIQVDADGGVDVTIVFPCVGCPAYELIRQDIRTTVGAVQGVTGVRVRVDWGQSWDKSDMAATAIERARVHGYVI